MLRLLSSAFQISLKTALRSTCDAIKPAATALVPRPVHDVATRMDYSTAFLQQAQCSLLQHPSLIQISNEVNSRTVTKFSLIKGKRKSVKTVLKRFYRLHWGGWIRTIAGRHRRLWAKSYRRRQRMKQHVLCNATQSKLLDKMVTNFWRKPKYYVNDPYEPYHTREEFSYTYRKPKPYFPPE